MIKEFGKTKKKMREVEHQIVPLQQGQTIPKTVPGLYWIKEKQNQRLSHRANVNHDSLK